MTNFNVIKIIGIDENRPPRVRKEAYIDIFYQLSEDAPEEWCEDFDSFGRHVSPQAKIDKGTRVIIGTYVNDIDTIPAHLEQIKQAVVDCNSQYLEKIKQREETMAKENADLSDQDGEQFRLNKIVATLRFDS